MATLTGTISDYDYMFEGLLNRFYEQIARSQVAITYGYGSSTAQKPISTLCHSCKKPVHGGRADMMGRCENTQKKRNKNIHILFTQRKEYAKTQKNKIDKWNTVLGTTASIMDWYKSECYCNVQTIV